LIKIATIDLYNNERNEGMRCIKEIVSEAQARNNGTEITYEVFDTRFKGEVPGIENDIFISSGGPGSPFEGEGLSGKKITSILFRKSGTTIKIILKEKSISFSSVIHFR